MLFRHTLRARLLAFSAALLVLVLVVAGAAIGGLATINESTKQINQTWLADARDLGALSNRIAEFRLAETYRALAYDPVSIVKAEQLASIHRAAIADLQKTYADRAGSTDRIGLAPFRRVWAAYLADHDAWIRSNSHGDASSLLAGQLQRRFVEADGRLDTLIRTTANAADAEADAADRTARRLTRLVAGVAVAAAVLALTLLVLLRAYVTGPLGAITSALSQLAAGVRDLRLPELHRKDEIGELAKAFDVFRNNAAELERAHAETQAAQQQASALARHDPLTGLPNRRVLTADLEAAIGQARDGASAYAVMVIDLDRFKPINDLHGHAAGDTVLCEIGRRLEGFGADDRTIARLGGDEFAVIARMPAGSGYVEAAMELAGRLATALREPIWLGEGWTEVGASVGVASCPTDGMEVAQLLRAADLAMYRAKQSARGTVRFFEAAMDDEVRAKAALEADLRSAVSAGDVRPYYQPLVTLQDRRVRSFEVLARWEHPERGFVPPDIFIGLADQLGLASELTNAILRQACRDARGWRDDIRLAVNVWPAQLQDRHFPLRVLAILSEERFPPSRLEIEVTESALVGDIDTAKAVLSDLRQLGISVALDDFGTGYSSLYHLRELRFDKLKIDRSFILSLKDNQESEKIVDAMLGLARTLGMDAVAEGIETQETLSLLADRGCRYGQGYLFSKAVPAAMAEQILARVGEQARLSA